MTHVYALGHLMGRPDCAALVDHGVAALRGRFHDDVHGGWYAKVGPDGPVTTRQDRLRARVRGARRGQRDRGRAPGRRASCSTTRSACCSTTSGTTSSAWSSSSGTSPSPRSTATAASTPTCTPSRRCCRPPTCSATPALRERALRIVTRVVHDLARGTRLADPGALRRDLDAAAGLQRRRAGAPVPAVRRDHRALAGVGPAGAAPARRARRRRPRTGCSTTPGPCSTPSVREGWAVDGADGFVYTVDWSGCARRTRADALGGRRGDRDRRGPARRDGRVVVRRLVRHLVAARRRPASRPRARVVAARARPRRTSRAASRGRASRTPTTRSRPR